MRKVKNYLSLIKFSHTIFAMPFAMIGFSLGFIQSRLSDRQVLNQHLFMLLFLVILCMVFARSAAMAFNRWLDRHFDGRNPRTAIREIPAGIISANSALTFTVVAAFLFILTTFFINPLCFYLSPVALLVVLGYSYTKRFTSLCHLVLGIGLSLAPIGAYLAVTGKFAVLPILFSLAVIFWVSGFDIIYALQDEEFDKSQNLYSMPSWVGKSKALKISTVLHVLCAICVFAAGLYGSFGLWYWIGVALFMGMLFYQHSIVKPQDLSRVNLAFMTANGIASVVFAIFVITDLIARS
jgi:4-hydroxybenzoate polyprenyltransferase